MNYPLLKLIHSKEQVPDKYRGKSVITFMYKSGKSEYYLTNENPELTNDINNLLKLTSSMNLVEFTLGKGMIMACKRDTLPVDYWESINWEDKNTHGLYYDKVNDPMIIDQIFLNISYH